MPHKPWKLLLSFWAIVTLFTLAADSNAQETLQPYAPPILHSFLDSANVYPESVTVDQSSGTFFVGSVKEGTIYKGKIERPGLEVFSPPSACASEGPYSSFGSQWSPTFSWVCFSEANAT